MLDTSPSLTPNTVALAWPPATERCSWWPGGAGTWGIDEKATGPCRGSPPGPVPDGTGDRTTARAETERTFGGTVRGMARAMTEDEWHRFVMEGTRTGKLATVRKDGSPSVVPIWFVLDDGGACIVHDRFRIGEGPGHAA